MQYHFKIHKEKKGYWAQCIELEGCFAQADSLKELKNNINESLNLYLEEPKDSKELIPLPDTSIKTSKSIIKVDVDPFVAFAFLMRYFRVKNGLTQQEAAKKMGFETVYSYQRLEAKSCNPSLKMITKIKTVFPEFSVDYVIKK